MTLDEKFLQQLQHDADEAVRLGACAPKRLLAQAAQYGAASAVKQLLSRNRCSDNFDALAEKGLLRLSAEARVCSKEYGALFTDEEADACLQMLLDVGYFG